jgi:hypothetical protein
VRDWNALVRQRLGKVNLGATQQDEVISELASHLEDLVDDHLALGLSEPDAIARALDEVANWRALSKRIQRTKHEEELMNARVRNFWLPGFVCLVSAMALVMILGWAGVRPHLVAIGSLSLVLYLPWLAALPLLGAATSYWSSRAGGQRSARIAVALFPAFAMLAICCFVVITSAIFEPNAFIITHPVNVVVTVSNVVVVPAAALLLGSLPFLTPARRPQS